MKLGNKILSLKSIRSRLLALGGFAACCLVPALGATETAAVSAEDEVVNQELQAQEGDPTILKRRAWLETEWSHYRDGSDKIEETLGGLWSWRVTDNLDWAVRLKLLYDGYLAPDHSGQSDDWGIGDTKLAAGAAVRLGEDWRAGGGLELRMPTAEDNLGDDVWKLQEFGAMAWDATSWLSFSPSVEYNESLAEENGASPQNNIELFFPVTFILPHHWSVMARYEEKIDFENNNYVTPSGKVSLAKQFETVPIGLVVSFKKPFNTANKDFQVNFAITYFFQSKKAKKPSTS
jgi:hypothetical protein